MLLHTQPINARIDSSRPFPLFLCFFRVVFFSPSTRWADDNFVFLVHTLSVKYTLSAWNCLTNAHISQLTKYHGRRRWSLLIVILVIRSLYRNDIVTLPFGSRWVSSVTDWIKFFPITYRNDYFCGIAAEIRDFSRYKGKILWQTRSVSEISLL